MDWRLRAVYRVHALAPDFRADRLSPARAGLTLLPSPILAYPSQSLLNLFFARVRVSVCVDSGIFRVEKIRSLERKFLLFVIKIANTQSSFPAAGDFVV